MIKETICLKHQKNYMVIIKIQDIYDREGLCSKEFYFQIIAYVKRLLNKYLLQKQFNEDNINDCFVVIYEKVLKNYDVNKGCLGTFIHTIVRNYCTKVNYRLINNQNPISLDFEYINKDELRLFSNDSLEDEEIEDDNLDNVENYCSKLKYDDAYDDIEYYCDIVKQYEKLKELENVDINELHKLDAVRKDLLWNMLKQQFNHR